MLRFLPETKIDLIDENNNKWFQSGFTNIYEDDVKGRFVVTDLKHKIGLIDFSKVIIPFEYESIQNIRGDFYLVTKNGKLGVMDSNGIIKIPLNYDQINFVCDKERVYRWKVVNTMETKYVDTPYTVSKEYETYDNIIGEVVVDKVVNTDSLKAIYDRLIPVRDSDDCYIVQKNGKLGFVNAKSGNTLAPTYNDLRYLQHYYDDKTKKEVNLIVTKQNDKEGLIDEKGTVLLTTIYDDIRINGGNIQVNLDDLVGFYFCKTNKFFPPKNKGYKGMVTITEEGNYDFEFRLIGVYEDSVKDWYYIGENGTVFKE